MTSAWVTVVGTLGGAIVGGLAGLGGQWLQWRRDRTTRWDASRKDVYAQFLAKSERTQNALWRVVYNITDRASAQVTERWREANGHYSDMTSQRDLVVFLAATQPTANTARAVADNLLAFKEKIYEEQDKGDKAQFKTEGKYRASFDPLRDHFVRAAKKELGITDAIDIGK